jgi:hypothetical protein
MKTWKAVFLAVVLVSTLVASVGVSAQNLQRGSVRGFVFDTTHSVVPNAKVTIFNPSTGYQREFTTDATGTYAFDQLLPGVYQIKAEATGFASITLTDVNVAIGSSQHLEITLPVKGQTTSVTVTAAVGAVDTSTAGINQIINQRNVETLPLSGRDYRDLAQLSSSAEVVPGLRGGIRLGGQQSDYSSLVIDGQDSFNNFFGEFFGSLETKNFTVPLESVQEFQVVTNGFAPEFGRATGGLINVVTKSGTNQVHGEAHEYYRGSSLTSNDALGFAPNISNQNQFGGSIGFPIKKDRQFLFLATDVQRENGPLATNFCTPAASCSDNFNLTTITGPAFAVCNPGACAPGTIPLPSAATAGFALPASCGSPTAGQTLMQACFGVNSLADFLGSSNQFQNLFTLLGHYDYQFSPANHFSIRGYGTRNHTSGFTGGLGQNQVPAAFGETENFINQGISGVFSLNTVLGRKVNEIRVSIEGETRKRHANGSGEPTMLICAFGPCSAPADTSCSVATACSTYLFGQRYYLPINNDNGKLEVADNFSYSFGRHDIKFGGDQDSFVDRKDTFVGWSSGQFEFASLQDFQNGTPEGFIQNFGLNNVPLFQAGTLFPAYQTTVGLYLQDKWQVSPRFTLTYGLRWDGTWNPQPQTPFPGTTWYSGTGLPGPGGSRVIDVPQRVPGDFNQWGPRVGFAWNVGSTEAPTVIRGAWGLYYSQQPGIFLPTAGGGKTSGLFCFFDSSCLPGAGYPYLFPATTPLGVNQLCGTAFGCPGPNIVDPKFRNPRISNLTGSVEHTFAHNWILTATFAWVHSARLRTGGYGTEEAWYRNFLPCGTDAFGRTELCGNADYVGGALQSFSVAPLDPNLATFSNATASFAHGNYLSGVVNVTKRFSNHFQVFANYIWSQNKDNGASERDTDTYFGQQDPFNIGIDYGRNGLDIRHQFKAAGVYELPLGFTVSSAFIAHTGVPFPLYINTDINGDGVANSGFSHNNDRPTLMLNNNKTILVGRYAANQPGFAEWDARLQKDFRLTERYHVQLSGDFFNLTNRGNVYSNPDTNATVDYTGNCTARLAPPPPVPGFTGTVLGPFGLACTPFTAASLNAAKVASGYRAINQVAPGSTPFAFQAGVKFLF